MLSPRADMWWMSACPAPLWATDGWTGSVDECTMPVVAASIGGWYLGYREAPFASPTPVNNQHTICSNASATTTFYGRPM